MNQELQDYVRKSKEAGQSDEQIKESLLKSGWKDADISEMFSSELKAPNSWTQISTDPELNKAPKWLLLIFKFYGALLAITVTVGASITLSLFAATQPSFLFSLNALAVYGLLIVSLIIAFGSWELRKWFIPILGLNFINGIIFLYIDGFKLDLSLLMQLLFVILLVLGYYYRQYFTESYTSKKAYIIYGIFIIGLTLTHISLLLPSPDLDEISDAEIDAYSKVPEAGVANKIIENNLVGELIQLSPLENDFYGAKPIKTSLIFSPDATHYAYIISRFATSTREIAVVIDDKVGPFFQVEPTNLISNVLPINLLFLANGTLVYRVYGPGSIPGPDVPVLNPGEGIQFLKSSDYNIGNTYLVYGDRKIGPYADIDDIPLDWQTNDIAGDNPTNFYTVMRMKRPTAPNGCKCKDLLFLDGKIIAEHDEIERPAYLKERLTYAYRDGDGWYVSLDDSVFGPYANLKYSDIAISKITRDFDTGEVLYVVGDGGKEKLFRNGKLIAEHDEIVRIQNANIYTGRDRGIIKLYILNNQAPEITFDATGQIGFQSGPPYIYPGFKDGLSYIIDTDGPIFGPYQQVHLTRRTTDSSQPFQLCKSSSEGNGNEGTLYGYATWAQRNNRYVLIANGREVSEYDEIYPDIHFDEDAQLDKLFCNERAEVTFSTDGKHFAYAARSGKTWGVYLDGVLKQEYATKEQAPILSLSKNGRHLAVLLRQGINWRLLIDDKDLGFFEQKPEIVRFGEKSLFIAAIRDGDLLTYNPEIGPTVHPHKGVPYTELFFSLSDIEYANHIKDSDYILAVLRVDKKVDVISSKGSFGPYEEVYYGFQETQNGQDYYVIRDGRIVYLYQNRERLGALGDSEKIIDYVWGEGTLSHLSRPVIVEGRGVFYFSKQIDSRVALYNNSKLIDTYDSVLSPIQISSDKLKIYFGAIKNGFVKAVRI